MARAQIEGKELVLEWNSGVLKIPLKSLRREGDTIVGGLRQYCENLESWSLVLKINLRDNTAEILVKIPNHLASSTKLKLESVPEF